MNLPMSGALGVLGGVTHQLAAFLAAAMLSKASWHMRCFRTDSCCKAALEHSLCQQAKQNLVSIMPLVTGNPVMS